LEAAKKVEKFALLITSEDKSNNNKQQNKATHSFSLTTKPKSSTDLTFRSQQIWGDVSVVAGCALSIVWSI